MGATETIIKMAKENHGTVTTAMVVAAGFSRGNIKYFVDKGKIEKSSRGVYIAVVKDYRKIMATVRNSGIIIKRIMNIRKILRSWMHVIRLFS